MAYVRWGHDSHVYVFDNAAYGGTSCCGCSMKDDYEGEDPLYGTHAEMIQHLRQHQARGDRVPEYAFEGLAESPDNPLEVPNL